MAVLLWKSLWQQVTQLIYPWLGPSAVMRTWGFFWSEIKSNLKMVSKCHDSFLNNQNSTLNEMGIMLCFGGLQLSTCECSFAMFPMYVR